MSLAIDNIIHDFNVMDSAFVSYARKFKDDNVTYDTIRYLCCDGALIAYDKLLSLIPGPPWKDRIANIIKNCKYAIVFISPEWFASKECIDELKLLIKRREQDNSFLIIPVLMEEMAVLDAAAAAKGKEDEFDVIKKFELCEGVYKKKLRDPADIARQIVAALKDADKRISIKKFRNISLTLIPVIFFVIIIFLISAFKVFDFDIITNLEETSKRRRTVQKIDRQVETLLASNKRFKPAKDGRTRYKDPYTNTLLAVDLFENGLIQIRKYYEDNKLIATDSFNFDATGSFIITKKRNYTNLNVEDEFDPITGTLIETRVFPKGDSNEAYTRKPVDFESPLPQFIILYPFRY
jgi:hypothetical protein